MQYQKLGLTVLVTLALAACGGGGGGGSDSSSSDTGSDSSSSSDTSLQTSVAATTYTSGSYEETAFNLVNSERQKCGFGLVAQNTLLDTAAYGHANYARLRLLEGVGTAHTEDSTLSGYYGATLSDRLSTAGYSYSSASEDIYYYLLAITDDYGSGLVHNTMASVYHMASMLNGNREAGVSIQTAADAPSGYQQAVMVWENATATGAAQQQTTDLVTYPCEGSTNIQPYMLSVESPEPFTNLGFTSGSSVGQPIYFKAPEGSTISITSATLTSAAGTSVTVDVLNKDNDPNSELESNQVFLVPTSPLTTGTTYTVTAAGTIDGTAFTKSFSFSTLSTW